MIYGGGAQLCSKVIYINLLMTLCKWLRPLPLGLEPVQCTVE